MSGQEFYSVAFLDSLLNLYPYPPDSVYVNHLNRALPRIKSENDTLGCCKTYNFLSDFAYRSRQYTIHASHVDSAFLYCNSNSNLIPLSELTNTYNNLGLVYDLRGNPRKSTAYYLKSIELDISDGYYAGALLTYGNLAITYLLKGDRNKSLELTTKANNLINDPQIANSFKESEDLYRKSETSYRLAWAYSIDKQYDLSNETALESLKQISRYKKNREKSNKIKIDCHHLMAVNFFEMNEADKALREIRLSERIQIQTPYRNYRTKELNGVYYLQKENFEEALNYLTVSLDTALIRFKDSKEYPAIPRIQSQIAKSYFGLNNSEKALNTIQKALSYFDDSIEGDLMRNPDIGKLDMFLRAYTILEQKADVATALFNQTKDSLYLEVALNTLLSTSDLIDKMRKEFLMEESKFDVVSNALNIYDKTINLLAAKYKLFPSGDVLSDMIAVFENNKSSVLFESVRNKFSLLSSEVPDSLIEKELDLSSEISFYKKQLSLAQIESKPTSDIDEQLFALNQELSILDNKLQHEYPEYYEIKYGNDEKIKLEDMQAKLDNNNQLIEYYFNNDNLYVIHIGKSKIQFKVLDAKAVTENTKIIKSQLSINPTDELYKADSLRIALKELFMKLKLNETLSDDINQIFIIPDGILKTIPFESLISGQDTYLLNTVAVSYYYSANQFIAKSKRKPLNIKLLAASSKFDGIQRETRSCDIDKLNALAFAQREVSYLRSNFEGTFLENATKLGILDGIKQKDIIHLGTHACLNDEDAMLSEIHFNDSYLSVYDIKDLNITPELIVLSACNTGQGTLLEGEGIIGLSRGFFEAGAKSLQSSLWEINDMSSYQITSGMYAYLKKGYSRSQALRLAKLDFIRSSDKLNQQPYFWAGIIHTGDHDALFHKPVNSKLILLLAFMFLSLAYLVFESKKVKAS